MSFLTTLASALKAGAAPSRPPLARSFASPWLFPEAYGLSSPRGTFNCEASVRAGYIQNPVAQRAVRLVAEGVGSAPLTASNPAMLALVAATSAGQSLAETLAAQLLLHGNGFVQVLKDPRGRPVELFALRPERVTIVPDEAGWPAAFDYRVAEKAVRIPALDDLGRPELIHLKGYHPADDHYGAGCLDAAGEGIAVHNAASAWNRALLENGARPSGALVYDTGEPGAVLTPDQFDRLKAELAGAYAGAANAGRPMLLEGGLKWQPLSLSPADMDFATLKAAAARDIALAFGVPPMLLGLPGDSTYANYREANRALWRLTLLPLAGKIFAAIAEGLLPWFPDATLSVDQNRVPALSEDRERLWAQVTAADFLSAEEKRALLGLEPATRDTADDAG